MADLNLQLDALRQIGDVSQEGFIIYSLTDEKVLYANTASSAITGLYESASRQEILSLLDSVHHEDKEYLTSRYSSLKTGRAIQDVELRLRTIEGDRHICCNAFLITNYSVLVIQIRDISKSKQHENYLVEFGAKKNTILDTLMHQISGALNLMQNLAAEAEKYTKSNDQTLKGYLRLVTENSKHCLAIINDLMEEEHLKSPNIHVKSVRIDAVQKISFIVEELRESYHARQFIFHHPGESMFLHTDEVKLLQVVNNLVSNAIKFSPATEPVVISIEAHEAEIQITVKDSGIGIPGDLAPYVFDHKTKAGRTGLNGEISNGIGLSICKNLVTLLGGKIWFESKEMKGTIFNVALPRT
jgi:two-component system, OmpR family, sensor histidine kinase VicK